MLLFNVFQSFEFTLLHELIMTLGRHHLLQTDNLTLTFIGDLPLLRERVLSRCVGVTELSDLGL